MGIDRIEVIQLPASDLPRVKAFYQRLFDLGPQAENPDVPGSAMIVEFPGGGPDLYLQRPPAPYRRPEGPLISLRVTPGTSTTELLERVEEAGGVLTYREPINPDLLVVGFDDTEGNHLELLIPR